MEMFKINYISSRKKTLKKSFFLPKISSFAIFLALKKSQSKKNFNILKMFLGLKILEFFFYFGVNSFEGF